MGLLLELLKAQAELTREETLKEIGAQLEKQLAPEDTWFIAGRKFIQALLQGKIPK